MHTGQVTEVKKKTYACLSYCDLFLLLLVSTTNLDLTRDRQIRRKTRKHKNRWNEQGSNQHLDAAPIALPRQDQAHDH